MPMPSLPITHFPQRQPGECLAACAAMVLDYLNVPFDYPALVTQLRLRPRLGAPFRNLRHLETLGVKVLVERGDLETLRACLEHGLPPITLVDTSQLPYWTEATAHAVVVVGLEGNQIYLNDPNFPDAPKVIPTNEFELAWIDLDQFYALIELG